MSNRSIECRRHVELEATLRLALKNAEAIVSSNLPQDCPDCEATMVWVHSMAQSIVQSIKEALSSPNGEAQPAVTEPHKRTWIEPREWRGLTDEDKMAFLAQDFGGNRLDAMDWAEERLKEKNNVSR